MNFVIHKHPKKVLLERSLALFTILFAGISLLFHVASISLFKALACGFLGWFSWTFFEYAFHRFVEHKPGQSLKLKDWHGHGLHHQHPEDPEHAFFSLPCVLSIFGFSLAVFFLLSWNVSTALLLHGGLIAGYLHYEWVHYAVHNIQSENPLLKSVIRNHHLHHFVNPSAHFGFTTVFWDDLFHTSGTK